MKKLIGYTGIILIILLVLVYTIIPNHIQISSTAAFPNNIKGLFRNVADQSSWKKWWPGSQKDTSGQFLLNQSSFKLTDVTSTDVSIALANGPIQTKSLLVFIPLQADSVELHWSASVTTSYNPLERVRIYLASMQLKKDIQQTLGAIKNFYRSDKEIYGLDIRRESVKDTSLVFTYDSSRGYPTTERIYTMVDLLRNHLKYYQAVATDSAMLNIYTTDSKDYLVKVALPASKILPSEGKVFYKWMLPHGNILVADVTGGHLATTQALKTLELYMHDYNLAAPAIPFYKLITNRMQEKDSTKWITRVYYPVMYYK